MNVIAGIYKHHSLQSPKDERVHPMGAREKNALFNSLNSYIEGATVLDAFAGSGALGIEALSRGAESCVFIEKSPKVATIISENLHALGSEAEQRGEVIVTDASYFSRPYSFDLIVVDPPYDHFDMATVHHLTDALKMGGIFALSHPHDQVFSVPKMRLLSTRTYAAATISIFQKT